MPIRSNRDRSRRVLETALFAMFAAMMFVSKLMMEFLPNFHLLGMLTVLMTVVFRWRALIPIYLYVALQGLYAGFNLWWMPYLYIWTVLWAIAMLIPQSIPKRAAVIVYPVICSLHGFLYGILYAPAQALLFGLNFEQMIAWIIAGFPWDIVHGVGNLVVGTLIYPLSVILRKLLRQRGFSDIGVRETKDV